MCWCELWERDRGNFNFSELSPFNWPPYHQIIFLHPKWSLDSRLNWHSIRKATKIFPFPRKLDIKPLSIQSKNFPMAISWKIFLLFTLFISHVSLGHQRERGFLRLLSWHWQEFNGNTQSSRFFLQVYVVQTFS